MTRSQVSQAYFGSNAQLTIALMDALLCSGPDGELAVLLFKAQKASTRAKKYRGRSATGDSYRDLAYNRKTDSLLALADFLDASGGECWGWKIDDKAGHANKWVLYIDLPNGQVRGHGLPARIMAVIGTAQA